MDHLAAMPAKSRRSISCRATAYCLALFGYLDASIAQTSADRLCWKDFPIPTTAVDYKRALAEQTLNPQQILVDGQILKPGQSEAQVSRLLRTAPTHSADWEERTEQDQCEFLLTLLRAHPNSMHLYGLGDLKQRRMSGQFRTAEWQIMGVGRLSAYLHRRATTDPDQTYLFHLKLDPARADAVQQVRGRATVLIRPGPPRVQWDVDLNRVTIDRRVKRQ